MYLNSLFHKDFKICMSLAKYSSFIPKVKNSILYLSVVEKAATFYVTIWSHICLFYKIWPDCTQ